MRLNRRSLPWAFAWEKPFRVIASPELLGARVGVMVILLESDWRWPAESTGVISIGCATDNQ